MKIYISIFSIMVVLLAFSGHSYGYVFKDDFNRDNDPNLNNGWVETIWYGDDVTSEIPPVLQFDPQLVNSQGQFVRVGTEDTRVYATVAHDVTGLYDISVDLKLSSANNVSVDDARLGLTVIDESDNSFSVELGGIADPNLPNQETIHISYNDVEQMTGTVDDYTVFNNYKITVSEAGSVAVYFNDQLQMETIDGVMGALVSAEISSTRWWRWHGFYFDNFLAVGDIETCEDVKLIGKQLPMDFDGDCEVGQGELAALIGDWMKCNVPYQTGCE
ncbi:MAG: hypothetical protein ACIAQZ_15800 [Sedimentisphaeraceae bacterium JB056]